MPTAKRGFERFVAWLHLPTTPAPPEVKQLARLIHTNFEQLARTVRHHSQRSVSLVNLAREALAQTSDLPLEVQATGQVGVWPWRRLRSMTLGPFRGFRTAEPFDIQKRVILVYGPNGSGKTSFCEGLEFGLLGSTKEAESRRIEDRKYLANLHAGRFEPPTLRATDHQEREVAVASNPDAFRFCFIEKNRIDAFSRIAAHPPTQRTELISTLFGMDKFNEFVGHFNESIDQQLVITPTKQLALTSKRNVLASDEITVNGEAQSLVELATEEASLAHTHSAGMTYSELKRLIGSDDTPGRLSQLGSILDIVPPEIIGITRDGLHKAFEESHQYYVQLRNIASKLDAKSNQVSFKDLYTAVLALQDTEHDHCPACDTKLADVKSNPYDKATVGIAQLKELGELQEEFRDAKADAARASVELRRQLGKLVEFVTSVGEQEVPSARYLAELPTEPVENWWAEIYPVQVQPESSTAEVVVTLDQILELADRVAAQDAASLLARQERQKNKAERDTLNRFQLLIQAQEIKRQQVVDSVAAAAGRIAAFNVDNATLIQEANQEAADILRDAPIKAAYDRFLALLKTYRNQLPGTLMSGLNDAAMSLYNDFNCNDMEADKLAALYLPQSVEEKIEISFRGNPGIRVDALHVLSEGHIRCLGLSILLAKCLSVQSPLIVFDDVINAIDHDHRSGIRETIFESDRFVQTQLIVTCHSNEFIKDIQQHLPAQRRSDCHVYTFRNHNGNYQPRVIGNLSSRNYIQMARASKDELDDRQALAFSRQGLEMISEKVWKWLASHDLGELILPLAFGSEPGLRNLCEALRKRLEGSTTFSHTNKPTLLAAYSRILGIPAVNLVWTYLNKGTHEEANRDDFDATLVESVVQTLESMDALDLRVGR